MEPECWGSNTDLATSWLCDHSGYNLRITLVDVDKAFRTVPTHSKNSVNVLYMCVYRKCIYTYMRMYRMCIYAHNRYMLYTQHTYAHMYTWLPEDMYIIHNILIFYIMGKYIYAYVFVWVSLP